MKTNNAKNQFLLSHILVAFIGVCFLAGCTDYNMTPTLLSADRENNELQLSQAEKRMLRYMDTNFTFQEAEARKHASDIAKSFDAVDGTTRVVGKPIIIDLPMKQGDGEEYTKRDATPELYVYNFEPYGFTVIGADERSLGELFNSATSRIDEKSHAGYQILMEGSVAKVFRDREDFYQKQDSIFSLNEFYQLQQKIKDYFSKKEASEKSFLSKVYSAVEGLFGSPVYAAKPPKDGGSDYNVHHFTTTKIYIEGEKRTLIQEPLLRTDFHQFFPYNSWMSGLNCTKYSEQKGRALAGCVPIAFAQLILYHNSSIPQQLVPGLQELRDYHYNSNTMKAGHGDSYPNARLNDIAGNLIQKIYHTGGNSVSKSQGCAVTNMVVVDLSRFIFNQGWGFFNNSPQGFDFNAVKQSIMQSKPVLIRGDAGKFGGWFCDQWGWWCNYDRGHAWVVDGIEKTRVDYTAVTEIIDCYRYVPKEIDDGPNRRRSWTSCASYGNRISVVSKSIIEDNSTRIHNNWGWGGTANYEEYQSGEWANSGAYFDSKKNDMKGPLNFQYNVQIYPFITKF